MKNWKVGDLITIRGWSDRFVTEDAKFAINDQAICKVRNMYGRVVKTSAYSKRSIFHSGSPDGKGLRVDIIRDSLHIPSASKVGKKIFVPYETSEDEQFKAFPRLSEWSP